MLFAKDTGIVRPTEVDLSTRGAKLFAKETGTVVSPGTSTSTKGGNGGTKK